jgi:hypothetical protein
LNKKQATTKNAERTKLATTKGIIVIPVIIARKGFIALYFLNLNASFKRNVILLK